jgi:hypothetical protein
MLLLDAPFDSQPQEAVEIDWGNSITDGLLWAQNGSSLLNTFGRQDIIQVNGTISPSEANAIGSGLQFSASQWVRCYETGAPRGDRQFTGLVVMTRIGSGRATVMGAFPGAGGTGMTYFGYTVTGQLEVDTNDGQFRVNVSSFAPIAVGASGVLCARWRGDNGADVFWNGTRTDNPYTTALGTLAPREIQLGSWNAGGDALFNGILHSSFFWDRELSDEEVRSVSANPWQLFRAPVDYWVPSVSPTILTPDATLSNTNWSAVGAASLHAALAAGDSDYITASTAGAVAELSLTNPSPLLTLTDASFTVRARLN